MEKEDNTADFEIIELIKNWTPIEEKLKLPFYTEEKENIVYIECDKFHSI